MAQPFFLFAAVVVGATGALLVAFLARKPGSGELAQLLAVLGGVFLFFAIGLLFKGLGIASPLDGILVPPPLPK